MNKEQAKIKLETDIANYKNKIKFLDPTSMYTRWIADAQMYTEMELKKLTNTGEHQYADMEWKDSYSHVLTEREVLEFLLSNNKSKFKFHGDYTSMWHRLKEEIRDMFIFGYDLEEGTPSKYMNEAYGIVFKKMCELDNTEEFKILLYDLESSNKE